MATPQKISISLSSLIILAALWMMVALFIHEATTHSVERQAGALERKVKALTPFYHPITHSYHPSHGHYGQARQFQDWHPQPTTPTPNYSEAVLVRLKGTVIFDHDLSAWRQPASLPGLYPSIPAQPIPQLQLLRDDGLINFLMVVDTHPFHQSHRDQPMPETLRITIEGVRSPAGLVDASWLDNRLRALFEDHDFAVICDVLLAPLGDAAGRCWLAPPATNAANTIEAAGAANAPDTTDTALAMIHDTQLYPDLTDPASASASAPLDLAYRLLQEGVVIRDPLTNPVQADRRQRFDEDPGLQTMDQLYWEAERTARHQRLGVWHRYPTQLASTSHR
ncbi:MAG: hypothetical protein AAF213_00990 [Pseudomonadota bacterium]